MGVGIHAGHLECGRVEKGKRKVDVGEAGEVEVLGGHGLASARVGPALIVADGASLYARAVLAAARPVHAAAPAVLRVALGVQGISVVGPHAELGRRAAVAKLGAAHAERALLRALGRVRPALRLGVAVVLAPIAAEGRRVPAQVVGAAAGPIGAGRRRVARARGEIITPGEG